jgi:structural maintenance of chromosome 2
MNSDMEIRLHPKSGALVLEGFKSYPIRTQITGWDPSFNAITGGIISDITCSARLTIAQGLNGSGKSNILDAICFVLGMTNVSNVRFITFQHIVL